MPITHNLKLEHLSQDEFHRLDYRMMEIWFAVQGDLGRLCDEKIYQCEFVHRCEQTGYGTAVTEVPVYVTYRDFTKTYYVDVLVNSGGLYELKTVTALAPDHRKQALHYLLLLGLNHGKIVNLRPPSVEHEFVSTQLSPEKRHHYILDDRRWTDLDADSVWLRELMTELVADWGAFLEVELFYDAIEHFRGGEEKVVRQIELVARDRVLGAQRAHLLNDNTAFKLTAITRNGDAHADHLCRFLSHTKLSAIQWINFNHHEIQFITLNKSFCR